MPEKAKQFYEFEEYRLNVENPGLWRGNQLVPISPKALEVLSLLVCKKGEIVTRDELIETVWKDTFVEEGNINYTISLLRKIFVNKDLIQTIPRHGYRFTAEVREISGNGGSSTLIQDRKVEPSVVRRPFRWVFALVSAVLIFSLVGFAYFSRRESVAKLPSKPPSQTSEAMQSYLRGKMILDKRSVENREEKAIDEFQRSVMLDPTLAIAYAGLAEGFASLSVKTEYPQSRDTVAKAKTAVDKALALEPDLAEGYMVRGQIRRLADWDWKGSETDLRRSIELSPKNAAAHQRLAQTLSILGRQDEALAESQIAYDLDPISEVMISSRFSILEARGDYDEALKDAQNFLHENKGSNQAARAVATFLYHKHDYQGVIDLAEDFFAKNPDKTPFAWLSLLAASYDQIGQTDKSGAALRQLETLARNDSKAQYSLAMNYAELGRNDDAIAALEHCYDMREERMAWLNNEPRYANLRTDRRFQELLKKMNLG